MAKRLSKKQKEEIIKLFTIGKTIEELSIEFDCTKLTISRNLKKNLSEQKFKELITKEKLKNQNISKENKNNTNKDITILVMFSYEYLLPLLLLRWVLQLPLVLLGTTYF